MRANWEPIGESAPVEGCAERSTKEAAIYMIYCILQFEFGDSHVKRPSPGMQIFEIFGLLFG